MNFLAESNFKLIIKKVADPVSEATIMENKMHGSIVWELTPLVGKEGVSLPLECLPLLCWNDICGSPRNERSSKVPN